MQEEISMTEMHKAFTGALGVELIEPLGDRRGPLVLNGCRDGQILPFTRCDRSVRRASVSYTHMMPPANCKGHIIVLGVPPQQ